MPFYELECKKCGNIFDVFSPLMSEKENYIKKAKCEKCGSKSKQEHIKGANFNFSNPVGTDRWNSSNTGHDYRFKYNMPNVKKQREAAEIVSHMGTEPYNKIDDISSGKHFGEVK